MDSEFKNSDFLREVQSLHMAMEDCINRHGMQEHVVSILLTGVIDIDPEGEEDTLRALLSYNVHDEVIMEESFHFIRETYYKNALKDLKESGAENLEDLLGDLGIDVEPSDQE